LYSNKIQQAEIKIENVNSKLIDLESRMIELKQEEQEVNSINIDVLQNKTFNDFSIKMEIQGLRQNLSTKNSRITILENELKNIEKNEKEYSKNKKEYDDKKDNIEIYADLQKSWGKNGIQAIIIDNILPQIEDEINKYLKILSGDNISIIFKTQKEAKNGNKSETLDIIVKDSKGERSYERYSGGEKTRINFACHIGMSKFLTRRSGANIDFFIVDEGIGTLDETGKDDFIDTIKSLNLIFKQVMVISHIPDIKEAFNNKVLVTKDIFEGSKVSVIS
jgi:exonuclease SbcC